MKKNDVFNRQIDAALHGRIGHSTNCGSLRHWAEKIELQFADCSFMVQPIVGPAAQHATSIWKLLHFHFDQYMLEACHTAWAGFPEFMEDPLFAPLANYGESNEFKDQNVGFPRDCKCNNPSIKHGRRKK